MNDKALENHLKKTTIVSNVISIIVGLIVAMGVGYGFYYNTKSTLNSHSKEIHHIKDKVNTVQAQMNDINVFKGVSKVEIQALESKVINVESKITKMDDKLDQILLKLGQR